MPLRLSRPRPIGHVSLARKRPYPGTPRRPRSQTGRILGRTGSRPTSRPGPSAARPDRWVRTRGGRDDIPIRAPARVAVVLHALPGTRDEILDGLRSIPVPFDLIVTQSTKVPITIDRQRVPGASSIVVLEVDNHGRDILPLISVVNAGLLDPYHLILKVHTKRSVWREDHTELPGTGEAWRDRLLGDLLATLPTSARSRMPSRRDRSSGW